MKQDRQYKIAVDRQFWDKHQNQVGLNLDTLLKASQEKNSLDRSGNQL